MDILRTIVEPSLVSLADIGVKGIWKKALGVSREKLKEIYPTLFSPFKQIGNPVICNDLAASVGRV